MTLKEVEFTKGILAHIDSIIERPLSEWIDTDRALIVASLMDTRKVVQDDLEGAGVTFDD